jgi:hypothetical protein
MPVTASPTGENAAAKSPLRFASVTSDCSMLVKLPRSPSLKMTPSSRYAADEFNVNFSMASPAFPIAERSPSMRD